MKLDEKKGIVSLVKNDFTPLEKSKEGYLKGGFGSVIRMATSSTSTSNNCMCYGNDCHCNINNCNCPDGGCVLPPGGNNCQCGTTAPPTAPPVPPTTTTTTTTTTNMLAGFGF